MNDGNNATSPTPEQMRTLANTAMDFAVAHFDAGELDMASRYEQFEVMLRAAADQIEAVHEALSRHPKCDKYDEDDVVSCGWKSAVRDITWAVKGNAETP